LRIRVNAKKKIETRKKIVYLFGAGATHAELVNLYPKKVGDANFLDKNDLLIAGVSKRVCRNAKKTRVFSKQIRNLLSPVGLTNIELFISLIEKNVIRSDEIIEGLTKRIRRDISDRLTETRLSKFYLHRSLFEFHQKNNREELYGIISLNYDRVVDDAYKDILAVEPNYCLSLEDTNAVPLLKLHGGFDLEYRGKKLPILTPGINKNYLELPYNFIWGRALELLIDCDTLRVIGCSLSQNDMGLVDLLFKAHLARKEPYTMQMITFDPQDNRIKENYGFLPKIEKALEIEGIEIDGEIEGGLISDQTIRDPTTGSNPFKIWLKAKIQRSMKKDEIRKTKYVRKVLE